MTKHENGVAGQQLGLQARPMDLPTVLSNDLYDKACRRPRYLQIGKGTVNKPAFRRDIKLFNLSPQFSQLILNVSGH